MDPPYWIIDQLIIFKPQFNECLDNYTNIISNHKILIFSNNNDPNLAFKNNNLFEDINSRLYEYSSFNQPLVNSLSNLHNLEELTFGHYFNQPLNDSLSNLVNLRELTFGNRFNQPLNDSLTNLVNLRELTFGNRFNQPLNDSLSNITNLIYLNLNYHFNQPLGDSLSTLSNLRELTFGDVFNKPLSNSLLGLVNLRKLTFSRCFNQPLGDSLLDLIKLRELTFGKRFNQPINIPGWITKLVLNCNLQSIIDYLPSGIIELEFGHSFNLELNNLPSSIKKIKILNIYYDKKLNNLPNSIETLELRVHYKIPIDRKYKNLNILYLN